MSDETAKSPIPPVSRERLEQIIALTVLRKIDRDESALRSIIVDITQGAGEPGSVHRAVETLIKQAIDFGNRTEQNITSSTGQGDLLTIHARLQGSVVKALVALDSASATPLIAGIRPDTDEGKAFNPDNLIRSVISIPMLHQIEGDEAQVQSVLIEINSTFALGRTEAKKRVSQLVDIAIAAFPSSDEDQFVNQWKTDTSQQYVYARLRGDVIRKVAELDVNRRADQQPETSLTGDPAWRAIYHVWPDFKIRAQIWKSNATVKADASRRAFATTGRDIVWAVIDSGIDGAHPHFQLHKNLELPAGLRHMDFMGQKLVEITDPAQLTDDYGHGTHVAGIIAGELAPKYKALALSRERDSAGVISCKLESIVSPVTGVAPQCKLLSYKVLDKTGAGDVSTVIAAIQKIQELNGYGRQIVVHGVNMSLGYDFDPEWFACGQSPVCVEVDRLVRSGVSVVIAAGNTGKGFALTINDPGNAELAITVGATHRDMPHKYGVSYFSSKGPTGDGRRKPDLLAPGERIVSCGAGPDLKTYLRKATGTDLAAGVDAAYYLERSGTSMAAPHVSGIIAGFLSVRTEFIGLPEEIKKVLVGNATDLGREPAFQGGGLVDMMRAIQAV